MCVVLVVNFSKLRFNITSDTHKHFNQSSLGFSAATIPAVGQQHSLPRRVSQFVDNDVVRGGRERERTKIEIKERMESLVIIWKYHIVERKRRMDKCI